MTQQREETRYRKRLVAIPQHLEIHGFAVEEVGEELHAAVDGDHEQDADDVFLLPGPQVVGGVLEDEEEGQDDGDQAEDGGEEEAEVVEGDGVEERDFVDVAVFQGGVAGGPAGGDHGGGGGALERAGEVVVVGGVLLQDVY
ncbi:hypothetical protein LTS09_009927 [Friedmanniomyces endolithicus]|nr:hypothetical protein LTS09_009927 [Friedmanniomyces endolithicus]